MSAPNKVRMKARLKTRLRGLTLIELIVFIVIIGASLAGVLSVLNVVTKNSADPLVQKQVIAVAEALIDEIARAPFTWCDPNDSAAGSATQYADCSVAENNMGVESGETRGGTPGFDNVNDYNSFSMPTILDYQGATVTGLGSYSASVSISADADLGPIGRKIAAANAVLRIAVTVTGPGATSVTLHRYRSRYAPNITS